MKGIRRLLWVVGGRDYNEEVLMNLVLRPYADHGWVLITGSQRGADTIAENLWRRWECPYIGIPAKWGLQGKGGGPKRNLIIARDWAPQYLVHFPGGSGTRNAIETAKYHQIETLRALDPELDDISPTIHSHV